MKHDAVSLRQLSFLFRLERLSVLSVTRMLVINVSIPGVKIARSCAVWTMAVQSMYVTTYCTPCLKSLYWLKINERTYSVNFSLLPIKFLQPVNLAIFTTFSLFNLIAVPAPHLLLPFLARQLSPHSKSFI